MYKYHIFPFYLVEKDCNIVIYGMGDVGRQYVEQISVTQFCNIALAVDINYVNIKHPLITVKPVEEVTTTNSDYIIIANASFEIAKEMKKWLLKLGVEKEKIIWQDKMCSECDINEDIIHIKKNLETISNVTKNLDRMERVILSIDSFTRNEFALQNTRLGDNKYTKYYKELHEKMKEYKCPYQLCRVGKRNDGGYVMVDYFEGDKIAYSFGISDDVSWDRDMSDKGYNIFMYDHTINELPEENIHFHYFKKGITGQANYNEDIYATFNKLLNINGHIDKTNMILKMDIEGNEWSVLESLSENILNKFSQIVLELHGLTSYQNKESILNNLDKINRTHRLVHTHTNNYAKIEYFENRIIPDVLEVTYLIKSAFENKDFRQKEQHIDRYDDPCWEERGEISL